MKIIMNKAPTSISTLVFMDLEATGLPSTEYKIKATELAFVAVTREHFLSRNQGRKLEVPRVQNKLRLAFNPKRTIGNVVYELTGLCNENLYNQRPFDDDSANLILLFLQRLQPPICLIAHNGSKFDFCLLQTEMGKIGKTLPSDLLCADSYIAFQTLSTDGLISKNGEFIMNDLAPEIPQSFNYNDSHQKQKDAKDVANVKLLLSEKNKSNISELNQTHESISKNKSKDLKQQVVNNAYSSFHELFNHHNQHPNISENKNNIQNTTEDVIVISDDEVEEICESAPATVDLTTSPCIINSRTTTKNGKMKEPIECKSKTFANGKDDHQPLEIPNDKNFTQQQKSADISFPSEIELCLTEDMAFLEDYTQTLEFQQSEQLATPKKSLLETKIEISPSKRSKFISKEWNKQRYYNQQCEVTPQSSPKQPRCSDVKKCLDFEVQDKGSQRNNTTVCSEKMEKVSLLSGSKDISVSPNSLHKGFANFKLSTLYKTLVGDYPISTHSAEDDSYSLLRVCQAIKEQFIDWIDANAKPINTYKSLW